MRTRLTLCAATAAAVILTLTATASPASAATRTTVTRAIKQYTCPQTTCHSVRDLFQGQPLEITCYKRGQSISGNNVWYYTWAFEGEHNTYGYVSGQYVNTGADPRPGVPRC